MKVKGRKYIALITLISMLIVSFIPAQSFALEESEPEVFIVVKEMDKEEESEIIAEEEESEKEEEQETVVIEEEETEDNSLSVAEAEAKEEEKTDSETVTDEEKTETEISSETKKTDEKEDIDLLKLMSVKSLTEKGLTVDNEVLGEAYGETGNTEPDKWYFGNDLTIDEHLIFGEDRMYTEGKANRGFNCLLDNNISVPFYVTTNDPEVNYQDLTGKEISVTFHTNSAVVVDHFKIISGGDTYKASYAHRSPTAWSLKAGNSAESCDTVLAENLPVNATKAYEENNYEFDNTTPYKYYKFTVTALAGAGRSGHDSPFSNPTATCLLADILIGGPEETHEHDDGIKFNPWSSANSLPTEAGNYYLENDVTIPSTWTVPQGTTNLCLNGHGIRLASGVTVINIPSGSTLNLYDCGETVHYFTEPDTGYGLAKNIGDTNTGNQASFTGGYITGGTAMAENQGGGARVSGGTFNMYGGTVIGNGYYVSGDYGMRGSGVFVGGGMFRMYGGKIMYNYAGNEGGGVDLLGSSSQMEMYGGEISHNHANYESGGIHTWDSPTLKIYGGEICYNYSGDNGGAITIKLGTTYLSGGAIHDNSAKNRGGGIYYHNGSGILNVSGQASVTDNTAGGKSNNVYVAAGTIKVNDALSENAKIGVTLPSVTGTITSGLSGKGSAENFKSDNSEYGVRINNNEAEIAVMPHEHDGVTYQKWTSANSLPTSAGNYYLVNDVTISSTWIVPQGTTNLCLNGHTLRGSGVENVILVNAGATLTVCDCGTTGTITGGRSNSGYRYGAGVYVVNGHFIFKSGTISGNSLAAGSTGGGGVEAEGEDAVIDMYGGTICNNQAGYGGGVYVRGSTFNFYGGTISNNRALSTDGGGIHVYGGSAKLNMYGGTICDNTATAGGGIGVSGGGTVRILGGSITGNTSTQVGGGITNRRTNQSGDMNANISIAGNPVITGNIGAGNTSNMYLFNNLLLNIAGELTSDASIGVSMSSIGIFTSGLSGKGTKSNFTSDNSNYMVALKNGEACITNKALDVTVSGYEGDYDGNAHGITVSAPEGATVKYGIEEGAYTLDACPSYTDAGNYTVYYEVSKDGFTPSAGSATVKINPINANVTITGKTDTSEYDGEAHSVTGYDAVASSDLYDVATSIQFSGNATVSQTNVGTSYMGLTAEQFKNINSNFNNVLFVVTDGYQTVVSTDAIITTAPKTKGILVFDGSEQELIDEGTVTGGTFYYAIGNDEALPDDTEYKTEMPKASDAGYYYIWYKVKGDVNHNDIAPAYIKTTLAGEDWVTVSGVVCDSEKIPVGNVAVKLMQGNKIIDKARSDADGGYYFAVPAGLYNIIIKTDDATITNMVDVSGNMTKDVDVSNSSTESLLDVVNSDKNIVVGGLNEEAYAIRAGDSVSADKNVSVKLTVKSISEDDTEGAVKIAKDEADKNLEFFDLKVEKNVDSTVTELTETQNILEFAIPCPYANKRGIVAYHYHGSEVLTLTEIGSKAEKADGTFYVDKEKKMMYVYLSRFSTIAMGYTPYYSVKSNISLGGFAGNVSVTLAKVDSSEKYELNDVSLDDISFQDIPKGEYTMTIKWEDGAVNTLPPISISVK